MIDVLKKGFHTYFLEQPLDIKFILLLTIGIFLPFYITVPIIFATFIFLISNENRVKIILDTPYLNLFVFLGLLLLVTPLFYQNYIGFGCGVLLDIFFVLELYISRIITEKLFDLLCSICCVMSLICAVVAVVERVSGLQVRVMALTYNANFYAYMIELMVIVCFYKYFTTKKPLFLGIVLANLVALALTECRTAWVAIFIGLLLFLGITKKKRSLAMLVLLFAGAAVALNINPNLLPRYDSLDPSMINRLDIWSAAIKDFLKHPVFGRGLLALYQVTGNPMTPHAHNILFDLLECTGIVGTSVFAFFFGSMIKQMLHLLKLGDEHTVARIALCIGVLAATLTHGVVDAPVIGVQTGLLFFLMIAIRPNLAYEPAAAKSVPKLVKNDKLRTAEQMKN